MFSQQVKNLLPKRLPEGVALNLVSSQHLLLVLRGLKKQLYIKSSRVFKISLGLTVIFYLLGYQPVVAFPPIRQSIAQAEFAQNQSIKSDMSLDFSLPHPGYLTTRFSSWHPGVDLATGLGMPIHPITEGKIVEVNYGFWGLGHMVVVEHQEGFKSIYGHMGKIYVRVGDDVNASSILGEVGLTGHTSGPHTHLEVTRDGKYVDPLTILPNIANWPQDAGVAPQGAGSFQKEHTTPTPTPKVTTPSLKLLNINQTTTNQITPQSHLPRFVLE